MRDEINHTTLGSLAEGIASNAPAEFAEQLQTWFADRADTHEQTRAVALKKSRARHRSSET
jgi:hypothetical protein